MIILKSRKHLKEALRAKGLPSTTDTLNGYEQDGIIPTAQYGVQRNVNGIDRLYSDEEINLIVDLIAKNRAEKTSSFNG